MNYSIGLPLYQKPCKVKTLGCIKFKETNTYLIAMRPRFIFEFTGCKPFKQYNLGPKLISDTDYGNNRQKVLLKRIT